MDSEIKQEWVKALRSGDYEQGNRYLNHGDQFCCLGVLCELLAAKGVVTKIESPLSDSVRVMGYSHGSSPLVHTGFPDYSILNHIGLSEGVARGLAIANDDGVDFETIAGMIEQEA